MTWLITSGDTAKGNAAICELWDSIPEAPIEWSSEDNEMKYYDTLPSDD